MAEPTHIRVKVRQNRLVEEFRRAGRRFDKAGEDIPLAELSPAQITALEAEPFLVTERIVA